MGKEATCLTLLTMSMSVEYKTLQKCAASLTDLLQHDLSVSTKLFSKGLVPEKEHKWLLTVRGVSDEEKANRLVCCVTAGVKECAEHYHDFVNILRGESFFKDIVEKLSSTCSKPGHKLRI